MELSLVPLYEGAMLYREALNFAERHGFSLMQVIPGFTDPRDRRLLQMDAVCFRDD